MKNTNLVTMKAGLKLLSRVKALEYSCEKCGPSEMAVKAVVTEKIKTFALM